MLIPEYGLFPSQAEYDGVKLNVTKEGLIIGGVPLGEKFAKAVTQEKADLNFRRRELAKKFKDIHPQFLFTTISRCINKGLDYLAVSQHTSFFLFFYNLTPSLVKRFSVYSALLMWI